MFPLGSPLLNLFIYISKFLPGSLFLSGATVTLQITEIWITAREINFFFSDSHLVVANSKKLVAIYKERQSLFFNAVSVLDRPFKIKSGKRSLTCYNVDTRMDDIQRSPKSKMTSSYRSRCMCCVLETTLTSKFTADLLFLIFLILYISK